MTTTDRRDRFALIEKATHDNMYTIEGDPAAIDPSFATVRNISFERQGYQGVPSGNSLIEAAMAAEARRREYSARQAGKDEAAKGWMMVALATRTAGSDQGKTEFYFLAEAVANADDPKAILAKLNAEAVERVDAIASSIEVLFAERRAEKKEAKRAAKLAKRNADRETRKGVLAERFAGRGGVVYWKDGPVELDQPADA